MPRNASGFEFTWAHGPKFADVPQLTRSAGYAVDQPWSVLDKTVARYCSEHGLDLDPDFQRVHVWTEAQQIAFVEFKLRGGSSGGDLLLNDPLWGTGRRSGQFVLVDGKQRLHAVLRFLRDEIPVFGARLHEYGDHLGFWPSLRFHVNNLKTRAEVLQWYLEHNAGGTPHTVTEIDRVRKLLEEERHNPTPPTRGLPETDRRRR